MNKKFFKRITAFALAATLVIGNGAIALAAGETSGTANGQGSNEGHVKRHLVSVQLPTNPGDSYDYVMDAERLVPETNGAKYDNTTVFTDNAKKYGIYFASGSPITYDNTSVAQKVTNESSADIQLTVKAEFVSQQSTDIAIVDTKPAEAKFSTGGAYNDAELYMQLNITTGQSVVAKALKKEEAVESTITIGGVKDNFDVFATSGSERYEYRQKDGVDPNSWEKAEIRLEGYCTYAEAGNDSGKLTAPEVQLTWSWTDPNAGPQLSVTAGGVITMSGLTAAKNFKSLVVTDTATGDSNDVAQTGSYTQDTTNYDASTGGTFSVTLGEVWKFYNTKSCSVVLTLTDDTTVTKTVTFNIQ